MYKNYLDTYFPDEKEYLDNIGASMQDIMRLSSELVYLKKQGNNESQIKEKGLEFAKSENEFKTDVNLALESEKNELKERTELTKNDMEKLKINSLMFGLFSIFMALTMSHFTSNLILTPINKLKNASYEISKGNLDTKLEFNTNDEFVALGNTFNQMNEKIKLSISEQKISNE